MDISNESLNYIIDTFINHYLTVQEELKKENKDPDELARSMALTEVKVFNDILDISDQIFREEVRKLDKLAQKHESGYLERDHTKIEATLTDWTTLLTIREYLSEQNLLSREQFMFILYQKMNDYKEGKYDYKEILAIMRKKFDEQFPKLH